MSKNKKAWSGTTPPGVQEGQAAESEILGTHLSLVKLRGDSPTHSFFLKASSAMEIIADWDRQVVTMIEGNKVTHVPFANAAWFLEA